MHDQIEFKLFGRSIERVAILFGGALIVWSVFVSLISQSESLTSMIPAFFGLPISILGLLSLRYPNRQKLFMHINVFLGLLVFIGGLDLVRSLVSGNASFDNPWADVSKLFMAVSGAFFCYACVQSFLHVRRVRQSQSTEDAI